MQTIFELKDGEYQNIKELEKLLNEGWKVILTTKVNYNKTTLFILENNN